MLMAGHPGVSSVCPNPASLAGAALTSPFLSPPPVLAPSFQAPSFQAPSFQAPSFQAKWAASSAPHQQLRDLELIELRNLNRELIRGKQQLVAEVLEAKSEAAETRAGGRAAAARMELLRGELADGRAERMVLLKELVSKENLSGQTDQYS